MMRKKRNCLEVFIYLVGEEGRDRVDGDCDEEKRVSRYRLAFMTVSGMHVSLIQKHSTSTGDNFHLYLANTKVFHVSVSILRRVTMLSIISNINKATHRFGFLHMI